MMTTAQSKLLKLAEECSEVAQEAAKQMHFGPDAEYEGKLSKKRLRNELLDVVVVVRMLEQLGEIDPISEADIQAHFASKLPKINFYTKKAHALGTLAECWVPNHI